MYYFSNESRRLRYGDERPISIGVTHTVEGPLRLCSNGLHYSNRAYFALRAGPGTVLWIIEPGDKVVTDGYKSASNSRTYIDGGIDIRPLIIDWVKDCYHDLAQVHSEKYGTHFFSESSPYEPRFIRLNRDSASHTDILRDLEYSLTRTLKIPLHYHSVNLSVSAVGRKWMSNLEDQIEIFLSKTKKSYIYFH